MFSILLFFYILFFSIMLLLFFYLTYKNRMKNDLLFFVIVNFILSFSFFVFLFYYKDYLFALVNILLLLFDSILMCYEIKQINNKFFVLSLPYLCYVMYIFYLTIDLCLIRL